MVPAPTLALHLANDASYFERLTACISQSETSPAQPGFATYQSNKILGRLFREIDEHRIWKESTQAEVTTRTSGGIWDGLLKHVESDLSAVNIILDWETKLATAKNLRTEYVSLGPSIWPFADVIDVLGTTRLWLKLCASFQSTQEGKYLKLKPSPGAA